MHNTTGQCDWRSSHQGDSDMLLVDRVISEGISQSRQSACQAHWSFLTSIVLSAASAAIGISGAALLLSGHASEGSVTAAVGLASGVYSHQISKDAAERQQQANERLDHMLQKLQAEKL